MKKLISVFAILFLMMSSLVIAQQPMKGRMGNRGLHSRQIMCDKLNLTEEQQAKMTDLRLANQKEMLPLRTELQSISTQIRLEQTEEKPDMKKIDKLIEQSGDIKVKMQKARVHHKMEVRKILTPEQQKIFDSSTLNGRAHKGMRARCVR